MSRSHATRRNGGGYLSLWVLGSEIRRRLGNRGAGPPSSSVNWTVGTLRGMLPIPPGVNRTSAHDDGEAAEPDDERFEVRREREEEGRGDAEAGQSDGRVEPRGRRDPTEGIARHASSDLLVEGFPRFAGRPSARGSRRSLSSSR